MSSIRPGDIVIPQSYLVGKKNPVVTVDSVRTRYKIDPSTHQRTDEIEGYAVDIVALRGKIQTVKLPLETKDVIEQIAGHLKENMVVNVTFGNPSTLKGRFYAMLNGSQLLSGVSCTASIIKIESIDAPEFDELDDILLGE